MSIQTIVVTSRAGLYENADIVELLPEAAIVSISDTGRSMPAITRCAQLLYVRFDDLTDSEREAAGWGTCITTAQADLIAAFLLAAQAAENVPVLICQCEYGLSRSVAVAVAAAAHFRVPFADHPDYAPNPLVFSAVTQALKARVAMPAQPDDAGQAQTPVASPWERIRAWIRF